jgi:hypothetical protein
MDCARFTRGIQSSQLGGVVVGKSIVALALVVVTGVLVSGCASVRGGPDRLYSVAEETQGIRENLKGFSLAEFSKLDEGSRIKFRNDWIAARMYAIDIQYTAYEAALTNERQNVGFGAAATTIGLTTASGLATSTMSKDILTGVAGAVTGARAAYENDILLAHSVQWVQSQMRTQRSLIGERILRGMKASTIDYPLAAALTDLEDYYRAGTFTGGMLGTTEALAAEANFAELNKQERIEIAYVPTAAGRALRACLLRPGVTAQQLTSLMAQPSNRGFALLLSGESPEVAEALLRKARVGGICP